MNRFFYSLTLTLLSSAVIQIPEALAQPSPVPVQEAQIGDNLKQTIQTAADNAEEELPIALIEDNAAFEEDKSGDQTIFFSDTETAAVKPSEGPVSPIEESRDPVSEPQPTPQEIIPAPATNAPQPQQTNSRPESIRTQVQMPTAAETEEQTILIEEETLPEIPDQEPQINHKDEAKPADVSSPTPAQISNSAPVAASTAASPTEAPAAAGEPIPLEKANADIPAPVSSETETPDETTAPEISQPETPREIQVNHSESAAQTSAPVVPEVKVAPTPVMPQTPVQEQVPAPMPSQAVQPSVPAQPRLKPSFALDSNAPIPSKLFGDTGFAPTVLNKQIAISPEQRAKMLMKKKYDEMDLNQDGVVTEQEFVDYKTNEARKIAIEIFKHVDIDHNGIISEEEYEILMKKMIDSYLKQPVVGHPSAKGKAPHESGGPRVTRN